VSDDYSIDSIDEILASLHAADIEFIVVGGTAAVMLGAPVVTQDLDIVHRRTPENVSRCGFKTKVSKCAC
jgi:hypothetical protein